SSLLLLGAPLVACEPRWLEILARAESLLERRRTRVHRGAVRYRVDGQRTRRVRVRKSANTVGAHALGELHRLRTSGRRARVTAAHGARSCGIVIAAAAADASTACADPDHRKGGHGRGLRPHYRPPVGPAP